VINLKKNIIETVFVRGGILALNLAITVIVARLWSAEGTGMVKLFAADIAIMSILCNIFTSSSVSYFLKRVGQSRLATQAYLWVFMVSGILALILSLRSGGSNLTLFLFVISVLLGFVAFHSSLFLGSQKIPYYNLVTLLQPLLLLLFMFTIYYVFQDKCSYNAYFYAQIISLLLVFLFAKIITRKILGKSVFDLDKKTIKDSFHFGWKVELSNLLQFFNYRVSWYILLYFSGIESVGILAAGVSIAEAIWIFSRSISLVQYSNVLQTGDTIKARKETSKFSLISFLASAICIAIIAVFPENIFVWIFKGTEFAYVKVIILLLSPGILAIAISNVYGHFFSATGMLNILIVKSAVGLLVAMVLSVLLIPKMGIAGACIVNSAAYITSSAVLVVLFFRKKRK